MSEPSKKLRILLTGPDLKDFKGGVQTHVVNFLQTFSNNPQIDIDFFVSTKGLYDQEGWLKKLARGILSIIPYVKKVKKNDYIHINSTLDGRCLLRDSFFLVIAKILSKRVIMQFHGGRASEILWSRFLVSRFFFNKVLSLCQRSIFLSKEQQLDFEKIFPDVLTRTTPNYIDMGVCPTKSSNAQPVFLFLARIEQPKGICELIGATKLLAGKKLRFKLIVCGEGKLCKWLVSEIDQSSLSEYVEYRGMVTGDQKSAILQGADVMVLPSHHEGFPYTILEAFKYCLPVIACPTGAIPDIIAHGENGFLVEKKNITELSDRMEYFCRNPSQIRVMGAQGRILAEKCFSADEMRVNFLRIYTEPR